MKNSISHNVNYTLDELKSMVNSVQNNIFIHKIKRHMHKIECDKNLPGEIFRKYPKIVNHATLEFRDYLQSFDGIHNFRPIEVSNYGRVRDCDFGILGPYEEKPGWLSVHMPTPNANCKAPRVFYPVYRLVAETWLECPFEDSLNWQVHHISNDGYDNTPDNLIWIKKDSHMVIPTRKDAGIMEVAEDRAEIERIIDLLNNSPEYYEREHFV